MSTGWRRRWAAAGCVALAATLAPASGAGAHGHAVGQTWLMNGATIGSGSSGTVVSAFANGAFPDLAYQMVLGHSNLPAHAGHACPVTVQVLNPTIRYATSTGFISRTVGTVASTTPPGVYQLCFQEASEAHTTSTGPVAFTVL